MWLIWWEDSCLSVLTCFLILLLFICSHLKFKTLDTVILPVVLCGCKTRSVVLKKVHTLKGVQSVVLLRTLDIILIKTWERFLNTTSGDFHVFPDFPEHNVNTAWKIV